MISLHEAKNKVSQKDGYRNFEYVPEHLQMEYISRAYDFMMREMLFDFCDTVIYKEYNVHIHSDKIESYLKSLQ